jgi:hypothetical protein
VATFFLAMAAVPVAQEKPKVQIPDAEVITPLDAKIPAWLSASSTT